VGRLAANTRCFSSMMKLPADQRHFLHVDDLNAAEIREVLELAKAIKPIVKSGSQNYKPVTGQTLAMIFCKPSTRTRVSFESGFYRLGGHAMCLGEEIGIGKREATKDISRVIASMNDVVMARLYAHKDILELAEYSNVPVINGLTDFNHPCQIVADALTVEEVLGSIEGKKVVYVGDGNNIVHSWLELAMLLPFDFVCACPPGFEPNADLVAKVQKSGAGTATVINDPIAGVKDADVVYADVWASMGQKEEAEERARVFAPYQVNEKLMAATGKEKTVFLHCLPAERGKETTDGVMESPQSYIFQQSENRMHAQNAIMVFCMGAARP
jgi:ornithine carbamoyltransferase